MATGPKRRTVYGKTRKEAAEKLTKAMTDRDGGLVFDGENQTVGEYLQRWLDDSVHGSVKPVTFEASVAITLDRYSHVLPGMSDQTAAAMESALS